MWEAAGTASLTSVGVYVTNANHIIVYVLFILFVVVSECLYELLLACESG